MGDQRSKEDEVHKISTSIFVTNFPDQFNAKDLWNVCKQYGNVVDAFIPNKRSKSARLFISFMGKVKEFGSLSNLKVVLANEGFDNIEIKYIGGYWVMIEFQSEAAKKMFEANVGTGKVFWVCDKEVLSWVPDFVDENDDENDTDDETREDVLNGEVVGLHKFSTLEGDSDVEEVPEMNFEEDISKSNKEDDSVGQKDTRSDNQFYAQCVIKVHSNEANESKRESVECFQSIQEEEVASGVKNNFAKYKSKEHMEGSVYDFDEVRKKAERFSSVFNAQGANAFNLFISNEGLKEVPLVSLEAELAELDSILYKGKGSADVINKQTFVVKSLQEAEKLQALKAAQKAKIKWAIEGDENSKYYHGILNKKRRYLLFKVFRLQFDMNFPNKLNLDQQADLENDVSKDEIKRAVWDCRIDKSPGPDEFTFEFYRRFWKFIKNDMVEVVLYFFHLGLFPKVMKSLHISFQRVVDAVMFKGIHIGSSLHLSYLFCADDAVFVGQWSVLNINTIVHVLDCFYRASSLRININKSKLLGISVDADKVDKAAAKIGCVTFKTLFSYLGSKVGGLMHHIQSWNEIVKSMVARLSKWKMKTLSIGDRLTLLKSVLGSMPIYHMSIFKVPMKVLQRMESICCHFFNGVDHIGKKPIWVKWNKVLASKEKGSLGVSSLYALNRALMFKWVSRFLTQSSSLWARVIKEIHGEDRKIGKNAKSAYPSIWLDIVHELELIKKQGIDLTGCIHKKIGNEANMSFWEDVWRGDVAFKYLYPIVYALELCKSVDVASKLSHINMSYLFRRDPRGGAEQAQYLEMLAKVEGTWLVDLRDSWVWSLDGSGEFTVASVRRLIDDRMLPEISSKTRWIKAVPIKVNVHAWKVSLFKIEDFQAAPASDLSTIKTNISHTKTSSQDMLNLLQLAVLVGGSSTPGSSAPITTKWEKPYETAPPKPLLVSPQQLRGRVWDYEIPKPISSIRPTEDICTSSSAQQSGDNKRKKKMFGNKVIILFEFVKHKYPIREINHVESSYCPTNLVESSLVHDFLDYQLEYEVSTKKREKANGNPKVQTANKATTPILNLFDALSTLVDNEDGGGNQTSSTNATHVVAKNNELERQMLDGKLVLVDEHEKPLEMKCAITMRRSLFDLVIHSPPIQSSKFSRSPESSPKQKKRKRVEELKLEMYIAGFVGVPFKKGHITAPSEKTLESLRLIKILDGQLEKREDKDFLLTKKVKLELIGIIQERE
ncbi:RNA-directed DNA polymerase, eukaryota, reverse transcriptase zinc-binding domain protein [Tanacetum coccineum]|uniref:RNA-directed DNA polymerase, eukaryota, reverse transcriptase zinc-binding domain protein n=1 Tax=Tanacetum coccineum TaxID=301880 RepID=A0ABQ4ZVZ3_9ASTR